MDWELHDTKTVIHQFNGWVGSCTKCGRIHWIKSGWATYYVDTGQVKGYHGFGPGGEWCAAGCRNTDGGPLVTVEPLEWDQQKAYIAAHAIGGDHAVSEMVDKTIINRQHGRRWR